MTRYEKSTGVDIERKLDPYPEMGKFASDTWALEGIAEGEITNSEEAYSALSLNAYHELFSDPRLEQDEVLAADEEELEQMQRIIEDNRPSGLRETRGKLFDLGYQNSPSRLVEDETNGGTTIEEAVEAFEDPYQDSDYVLRDEKALAEDVPLAGAFVRGRKKALSDKFYNMAAPQVKQRIGDVDIRVE